MNVDRGHSAQGKPLSWSGKWKNSIASSIMGTVILVPVPKEASRACESSREGEWCAEFLEKLAALITRPEVHLLLHHSVLAATPPGDLRPSPRALSVAWPRRASALPRLGRARAARLLLARCPRVSQQPSFANRGNVPCQPYPFGSKGHDVQS